MAIVDISDLPGVMPKGARLLGLDLGSKTIGLAISDSLFQIASPLETIHRRKFTADAESLKQIIGERNVGGLILGLPKNMDGSEGPRSQSTRQFAENLLGKFEIPIAFWDGVCRRLPSAHLIDKPLSRQKRGEVVDKIAASYILRRRSARDDNAPGGISLRNRC